ncbi:DUF2264 domain-containing protein [Pseudactinotalea sp.]|uniref:DUF2264 domain-containing protein n=1 Tax=Pseudactinotalea sp. TaxID=1926260 RepID=UPI003B3AA786
MPVQPLAHALTGARSSRTDVAEFAHALWLPVRDRLSPGRAAARLGGTGAHFDDDAAGLEGFARPLWGLVPLAAGGGDIDLDPVLAGIEAGADPASPEYWGEAVDRDQRLVEMAALGLGLALTPERFWDPLAPTSRDHLSRWLARINDVECNDNNWLFFRVLVNLGLDRVGSPLANPAGTEAALERLESFYLGDGWYADGAVGRADHYVPWAFHFYGLIYARLAGERDPARAERFRERAALIAEDFAHWFDDDGAALPYGRSLTYRFAASAFWGALAFADVEALPWARTRGLYTRHLQWWRGRDVDDRGVLPIGYAYPNLTMAEAYNSPGSPYWAAKAFLPLALAEDHPFWSAVPAPSRREPVRTQKHAALILCDDRDGGHVVGLAGGQNADQFRHGPEKYDKFAYSTSFGVSVPASGYWLHEQAGDSTLLLSEDGVQWRGRRAPEDVKIDDGIVWSRWRAFDDVEVETWLWPQLPWQLRVHLIRTGRPLRTAEGAWALDRTGDRPPTSRGPEPTTPGSASATTAAGFSGIRDLDGKRSGDVVRAAPNTNLIHPRTVIPTLLADLPAGTHVLRCAVLGSRHGEPAEWRTPVTPQPRTPITTPPVPLEGVLS